MKTLPKTILTFVLMLFGALASGAAMAQHHGHGYGHSGSVRFGLYFGAPFYAPAYYPPPYYGNYPAPYYAYPAPVYQVAPSSPPVYIEQGTAPQAGAPAPAQPQGDWYYCADSKTYYPYVKECSAGWQRVPAQPPSR
jgi:hypothetical protein